MRPTVLQFHNHRVLPGDDENELTALFLFSLMPESAVRAGEQPTHNDCFWTEVALSRDVAEQPGWKRLSRAEKIRCLYQHAVEQIAGAKRKLRQTPLIWTTSAPYRNGPPWDPAAIEFPRARPVTFDAEEAEGASRFLARQAAGLSR